MFIEGAKKMRFENDFIEEVRSRNDIIDVVSQYVKITRAGSSYKGLVRSIMTRPRRFRYIPEGRCTIVLRAALTETYSAFLWNMKA